MCELACLPLFAIPCPSHWQLNRKLRVCRPGHAPDPPPPVCPFIMWVMFRIGESCTLLWRFIWVWRSEFCCSECLNIYENSLYFYLRRFPEISNDLRHSLGLDFPNRSLAASAADSSDKLRIFSPVNTAELGCPLPIPAEFESSDAQLMIIACV